MKILLCIAGFLFISLALLGIVLPILPTAPFVLLAAACFARSSKRVDHWLKQHHLFGPIIFNWRETRSIPRKAKKMALFSIVFSGMISVFVVPTLTLKLLVTGILIIPLVIMVRTPCTEDIPQATETLQPPNV